MFWVIGCIANSAIALAYLLIAAAIMRPLLRGGQVRGNLLGTATAAVLFTAAIHHGGHVVQMLLPSLDIGERRGLALRDAFDWEMAAWDVVTALVGSYYWTLRRALSAQLRGVRPSEDMRQREDEAIALNDDVLQGLVVAKLAMELDQPERAMAALDASIAAASAMVSELLGPQTGTLQSLRRAQPATLQDRT